MFCRLIVTCFINEFVIAHLTFQKSNEKTFTGGPKFTLIKRKYIWNYSFNNSSPSEADQTMREQLLFNSKQMVPFFS